MHGITHLYRQHAVEKQLSADSACSTTHHHHHNNHSPFGVRNSYPRGDSISYESNDSSGSNNDTTNRLHSVDSGSSSGSSTNSKSPNWSQDKIIEKLVQSSSPQPVPEGSKSLNNHYRNSPSNANNMPRSSYDSYSNSFKHTSSKRNCFDRSHSPAVYASLRRCPNDYSGSPPVCATQGGYFPHDLDDIYESQADHQYFTHTGASSARTPERPSINSIFHRVGAAFTSLDDYVGQSNNSVESSSSYKHRFDNSSFAKSLSTNEDSDNSLPREHKKSKEHHHHHHHHHHSIQEMLKSFTKKVHIWPRKSHDTNSVCTSPLNDPQDNFRLRSKSLDVNTLSRRNRILEDCGATYKIYEKIVKEGAHMRRASADLEKRRASLGAASRGLRGDGTLDPHHAAILFRDSRGVSKKC